MIRNLKMKIWFLSRLRARLCNRKICFRIINHVRPLYIDLREGFGLEELFYTVIIGLITHKVAQANMIYDTEANLPVEHDLTIFPVESRADFPDGLTTIAPIHVSGIRLGSLNILRQGKKF